MSDEYLIKAGPPRLTFHLWLSQSTADKDTSLPGWPSTARQRLGLPDGCKSKSYLMSAWATLVGAAGKMVDFECQFH